MVLEEPPASSVHTPWAPAAAQPSGVTETRAAVFSSQGVVDHLNISECGEGREFQL